MALAIEGEKEIEPAGVLPAVSFLVRKPHAGGFRVAFLGAVCKTRTI